MKKKFISILVSTAILTASTSSLSFSAQTSPDIIVNVDTTENRREISPLIYGINDVSEVDVTTTAIRQGGNRYTGYNWENNYSNAGSDWQHSSDTYLLNSIPSDLKYEPGAAALWISQKASNMNVPYKMTTIQMAGYVSADGNGTVSEDEIAPSNRWKEVKASKDASFSLEPDTTDDYVYIDEYINYLVNKLGDSTTDTGINGYNLDNEPGLWSHTHPRIHPDNVTCEELVNKSIEYAKAIKNVDPNADIYGLALYGFAAYTGLQGATDWDSKYSGQYDWFISYYLDQMAKAEEENGIRLIDVIDTHYYSEATGGGERVTNCKDITNTECNEARVQAPRTLYDYEYIEDSWIGQWGSSKLPILPTIQESIDKYYPGTKMALTEYNFGGGNHISGAIAQADALGAFASNGVYLATMWPLDSLENIPYILSGINIYTNYDGNGSKFGNTLVKSETSNIDISTSYASIDNEDESKITLLLTNKNSTESQMATINLTNGSGINYSSAEIYGITQDSSDIKHLQSITEINNNTFTYEIPAFSVVQIEINSNDIQKDIKGDINGDEIVDFTDLKMLKAHILNSENLDADKSKKTDLDDDGNINAFDVLILKRIIFNKE